MKWAHVCSSASSAGCGSGGKEGAGCTAGACVPLLVLTGRVARTSDTACRAETSIDCDDQGDVVAAPDGADPVPPELAREPEPPVMRSFCRLSTKESTQVGVPCACWEGPHSCCSEAGRLEAPDVCCVPAISDVPCAGNWPAEAPAAEVEAVAANAVLGAAVVGAAVAAVAAGTEKCDAMTSTGRCQISASSALLHDLMTSGAFMPSDVRRMGASLDRMGRPHRMSSTRSSPPCG